MSTGVQERRSLEQVAGEATRHPAVTEGDQIVRHRALDLAGRARSRLTPDAGLERPMVGLLCFACFLTLGLLAAKVAGALPGDALSRVASAQAVVVGRDPHLEAIGFVWGPFPTVFEVPLVLFRTWWPDLASSGIAAVAVSSAFMAATATQLLAWGVECGAKRVFRLVAVGLFVLHPLVWVYGANGMSEACWLFFLVLATRHLSRWTETDDVRSLVVTGLALAGAYLTRYESAAAVAAAAVLVASVAWHRSHEAGLSSGDRVRSTVLDLTILSVPPVAAILGWAGAAWATVGEPFPQFTSQYGNSALVRAAGGDLVSIIGDLSAPGRAWFFLRQGLVAAPVLVPVVLLGCWVGRRTAARTVVATVVIGTPLVLQLLLAVHGGTFPWFRYVMAGVLLSATVLLAVGGARTFTARHRWLPFVALLALVPGAVMSFPVIRHGDLGSVDDTSVIDGVAAAFTGNRPASDHARILAAEQVAAGVDTRAGVVPGSVLTDTSSTFAVLTAAPRPDVYVVPSDRDFEAVLAAPANFGIRFVLLREPSASPSDSIESLYPSLWKDDGAPLGRQVAEWGGDAQPENHYRLYRLKLSHGRPHPVPGKGFTG